jgi:hypothetical protein
LEAGSQLFLLVPKRLVLRTGLGLELGPSAGVRLGLGLGCEVGT